MIVYNRTSLEAIKTVVLKYDLILVCNQAFKEFTLETEFIAPLSLSDMFKHIIKVCFIYKGMGLSGYRVDNIFAPDLIMDIMYAP